MANLVWQPERISRATTRAEWRDMDRSRRVLQRKLAEHEQEAIRAMRGAEIGSERLTEMACALSHPPLIMMPPAGDWADINIIPGGVTYVH